MFGKKLYPGKGIIAFAKEAKGIVDLTTEILNLLDATREKRYFELAYLYVRN